jgi:hypothetical protein
MLSERPAAPKLAAVHDQVRGRELLLVYPAIHASRDNLVALANLPCGEELIIERDGLVRHRILMSGCGMRTEPDFEEPFANGSRSIFPGDPLFGFQNRAQCPRKLLIFIEFSRYFLKDGLHKLPKLGLRW